MRVNSSSGVSGSSAYPVRVQPIARVMPARPVEQGEKDLRDIVELSREYNSLREVMESIPTRFLLPEYSEIVMLKNDDSVGEQ